MENAKTSIKIDFIDKTYMKLTYVAELPNCLLWTLKYLYKKDGAIGVFGSLVLTLLIVCQRAKFYRNGEQVGFVTFMETMQCQE